MKIMFRNVYKKYFKIALTIPTRTPFKTVFKICTINLFRNVFFFLKITIMYLVANTSYFMTKTLFNNIVILKSLLKLV